MRKSFILSLVLIIIFISGCVKQDGEFVPEYYDEALKMETEVSGEVLPEQAINMRIHLTNQVEHEVTNVELRITDFYGLKLRSQVCPENKQISDCGFISTICGCGLFDIQSLDDEEINFVFQVPSKDEIARIGRELEPEITLSYDYRGETTFLIPILGPNERYTSAKAQLVQTTGPIHVEIERGFTQSSDPWERSGSGFSIVVRVKDVINSKNEMTIYKDNFDVSLTNLERKTEYGHCDFDASMSPDKNITLPMKTPLVCAIVGNSGDAPWVYGQVRANYDYRYKVVETKSIKVETVIA